MTFRSTMRAIPLLLVLTSLASVLAGAEPATRSWIEIVGGGVHATVREGEPWQVTVAWRLDPADDRGGTRLTLQAVGPWIDCPDGTWTKERRHVGYPGADLRQSCDAAAGEGRHTFTFTVPRALERNSLLLIAHFTGKDGKAYPWQVRGDGPWVRRERAFFELDTDRPGHLFTYPADGGAGEPLRVVARLGEAATPGERKVLTVSVHDSAKAEVERVSVPFTVERAGQAVPFELTTRRRGILLVQASVEGWESRYTTICRVPDVLAVTGGKATAFGMHGSLMEGDPERLARVCGAAQRLGLTVSRNFVPWYRLEPAPGQYRFAQLDAAMDASRAHGIEPIVCIYEPPAWALNGSPRNVHFQSFAGDLDAFRRMVGAATTHWRGRMHAWEWLNEIVPGEGEDPVAAYLALCRAGTEAARAVEPTMPTLLAGGLFPRSFRTQVLAAGTGRWVDVLPVHYGSGEGVAEARADLDAAGLAKVAVWDDESARGVNAWGVPPLDQIADTVQSRWVMGQWVDELTAGCERLIWFGGWLDPAGGWSYLLDDGSPRPVCATLAVLCAKLHGARPLGAFSVSGRDGDGAFALFERGGTVTLCAFPADAAGARARLQVGAARLTATDHQGEESAIATADGVAELALPALGAFYEGGDPDTLKAYVVASLQASSGVAPRGGRRPAAFRTAMMTGEPGTLHVGLRNPYPRRLQGTVTAALLAGWSAAPPQSFDLAPGEAAVATLAVRVPAEAAVGEHTVGVTVAFSDARLPRIALPATISTISRAMLGNLLDNGGFEDADAKGAPRAWQGHGAVVPAAGLGLGLGERVLRFGGAAGWVSSSQTLKPPPGNTYLYSAWVWSRGMEAGSNLGQTMADGTTRTLYDINVFKAGLNNGAWQLYTCRWEAPPTLAAASFTPVAKGAGDALYDQLRLTLYAGSDYAAECHRVAAPPTVDGDLRDWDRRCPIPLLGANQLKRRDESYVWTPANLSAVAYLRWDAANLYLAVEVRDDRLVPAGEHAGVIDGDSIAIGIDPTGRGGDAAQRASQLLLSAVRPGGGSGTTTLFRPEGRTGGLPGGHLARDSSVCDIAIARREGDASGWIYELRVPFSQLGGFAPAIGRRLGISLQTNDRDADTRAATMAWGGGMETWAPADFGVVTIVE